MESPDKINFLTENLPDAASARRFFGELEAKHPAEAKKLLRAANENLLADTLALAAWSEFLARTLLQRPEYLLWLNRERADLRVRSTEDLLESLARFALTNSTVELPILLAGFRRRELLRVYLRDIRGLATVAETTLELSNLADAILEFALRAARQELENRFGAALETAPNNKTRQAEFCIVALGKLGSRELNYASDIDLLFLYSSDGATQSENSLTNREFFNKLAERTAKIVGQSTAEIAAYRVDLRLRPHGRAGALAVSAAEAEKYYRQTARDWERQVLIRARVAAGDARLFKQFAAAIEPLVYQRDVTVEKALRGVRESKHRINQEHKSEKGFNVKLGAGGIREIEFVAQALQLAHGGADEWLRQPHTLIALGRLAERQILNQTEFSNLADAYVFLRTLEHRLQMENGLQTHCVPNEIAKRQTLAKRLNCQSLTDFETALRQHTTNVSQVFRRVFEQTETATPNREKPFGSSKNATSAESLLNVAARESKIENRFDATLESSNQFAGTDFDKQKVVAAFCRISPHFAEVLTVNPRLVEFLPGANDAIETPDYAAELKKTVAGAENFAAELAALRQTWNRFYIEIAALDAFRRIESREASARQTRLAEAALEAALRVVKQELRRRFAQLTTDDFELSIGVLGLGKLASRGMDYGSDLDLVLIYDDARKSPIENLTAAEFYSRAAEILITALSSLTRDGQLYRVDLRLRPDGKNGASATGKNAFLNYLTERAAVWEWLAYVKLRHVGGACELSQTAEIAARQTIHRRARETDATILRAETKRIRDLLEQQKTTDLRAGEIDIKYGAGGLLDVYFAVRFLQLRDCIGDAETNRGTAFTLRKLREVNSLDSESFEVLNSGYEFLRRLDHALRLVAGRSTKLPGNQSSQVLANIAERLNFDSARDLLHALAVHAAEIRSVYRKILN